MPDGPFNSDFEVFINEVHPSPEGALPLDDYYPSAKVRIFIRFDEFADNSKDLAKLSSLTKKGGAKAGKAGSGKTVAKPAKTGGPPTQNKPPIKKKGISDNAPLTVGNDPNVPTGVTRLLLTGAGVGGLPGKANAPTSSADPYTHTLEGIIPRNANWSQNGARQADTLSVSLRWLDLPVDPRTVRSCAIEFYLGTVTAENFADGLAGKTRGAGPTFFGDTGAGPLNVVPDTYVDKNGRQRTNLRFSGWVDVWAVEWDQEGDPLVKLECRDNTALLLEQEAPPKLLVGAKKPLDRAVAEYLANFPQFAGFSVEYRPSGTTPPVLGTVMSKVSVKGGQGPAPAKAGGAATQGASNKLMVWDYLTDVCGAVGHMVRVEGTVIVIERARGYLADTYGRADDPFKQRTIQGETLYTRRMVWGRNIQSLKIARSYAKTAPQNIEVRSYVPEKKSVMIAHFPNTSKKPSANTISNPLAGSGKDEETWTVYRVTGIKDQATLNIIAQNIYEQICRGEFQVNLKTRSLGSFGGHNEDPDLLDMIAGDSLEVLVNRDEQELSSQTQIETLMALQSRARQFYSALGYDDGFANAASKAFTNGGFITVFRVKTMATTWDVEEGVTFDIAAINYLQVRADKELPPDQELPKGGTYF